MMRLPALSRNILLFLAFSALIDMGIYGVMDVLLNFFYRSLGFDLAQISVLQGSQRLGGLLFSLPAGLLITWIGARRTLMLTGTLLAASMFAMTLGDSFAWQYGARIVMGAMYTTFFIASIPLVAMLVKRDRYTSVFSLQFIAVSIAIALANSIGGSLPTLLSGAFPALGSAESTGAYGASLWIAAGIVALSLVPLTLLPKAQATTPSLEKPARTPAPWSAILLMSVPMLIFGMGAGLSIPYYNLFFRDTFDLPDAVIGNIFTFGSLSMMVITLIVPFTARRLGQVKALNAAMLATTAAFFLLSLSPSIAPTILFYGLALGFRNTMSPLYNPLLLDYIREEHHGLVSSMTTGAWSLGFFVITFFSGSWVEQYGYPFLFQITAATTLITGVSALFIFQALRGMRLAPQTAPIGD
jgi:MFS family permease